MSRLFLVAYTLVCFSAADAPRLSIVPAHAWRPPFGLDRVGCPDDALIEWSDDAAASVVLEQRENSRVICRETVGRPVTAPFRKLVRLDARCDEVVLLSAEGANLLATLPVERKSLDVVAIPRAEPEVNPVDLGTILVPAGWLLIGPNQTASVDLALASGHDGDMKIAAWYASNRDRRVTATAALVPNRRADIRLSLPKHAMDRPRDVLHVDVCDAAGVMRWQSTIPVMIVADPPKQPRFGATALKLRYDAPISVRDPRTGTYSTLDYDTAWDERLSDVVVSLPNGARFVFWRGSSYIPFWAGHKNTGLCMEWAEMLNRPPDAVDCVEPLMDKELRYGRVQIVESTPARVHVRWSYQSTDLNYKTWGDTAVEDYYFYPDGFGTRVLTLTADPAADYELSEFIILTPQGRYPLDVIPERPIDVVFQDGTKQLLSVPLDRKQDEALRVSRGWPAAYRVRFALDDAMTAIYCSPSESEPPPVWFGPFSDDGLQVTPAYWGSHWPLARGDATGGAINDRIDKTPSHNSLVSWARMKPKPLQSTTWNMGAGGTHARSMQVSTWAWLIGMTDMKDEELLRYVQCYVHEPRLLVNGLQLRMPGYAALRAFTFPFGPPQTVMDIKLDRPWVHAAFDYPAKWGPPREVLWNGRALESDRFVWGKGVLWLDTTFEESGRLEVRFDSQPDRERPEGPSK